MLGSMSRTARRLPYSRSKSRLGRVVGSVFPFFGADPVVTVATADGTFVLDTRSRTESGMVWNGRHDSNDIAFLKAVTPRDGTFVDIGANVGLILIPMIRHLAEGGRAIGVEPVAVNFDRLKSAVTLNAPRCSVQLENKALGRREGSLLMRKEGGAGASGNAVPVVDQGSGVSVPMTTFDGLTRRLGLTRVDTVKIDVEGFEAEVFAGGPWTISNFRPVVYGEFHNHLMPLAGSNFRDIWDIFHPREYSCFSFVGRLKILRQSNPSASLGNAILVPNERVGTLEAAGVELISD